jgi:tetratricopeptide (TPR) repeat protein
MLQKNMNKLFYLIIPFLIMVASWFVFDLGRYLPPDLIFHKGIKYESKNVQHRLTQELKNQDIPFRIRNDGFIEYRKKDDKKVQEIADKIYIETSGTSITSPEVDEIIDKCQDFIVEKRFDEALALLNGGISECKNAAILYNFRASVWSFKGEGEKAIADYTSAIDLAPNYHEAYKNRAMAWLRKNEYERAVQDYTLSINIYSRSPESHFYRAVAFSGLNQFQNALIDYTKATKLNTSWAGGSFRTDIPADPIYLFALAEHFAESRNFKEAIVIQERAIELLQKESNSKDILKYQERLKCYRNNELCNE